MTLEFARVKDTDWFKSEGALLAKHAENNYFTWDQLHTVHGYANRAEERSGLNRLHFKICAGFISHAGDPIPNYDVVNQENVLNNLGAEGQNHEFRRGDYVYMPQSSDNWQFHSWVEISRKWEYEGKTPPWKIMDNMCKLTEGTIGCGGTGCISRTKEWSCIANSL